MCVAVVPLTAYIVPTHISLRSASTWTSDYSAVSIEFTAKQKAAMIAVDVVVIAPVVRDTDVDGQKKPRAYAINS